ncbi:MAG: hypothetical protein ACKO6I_04750 [Sphingomonadales bacterium]
MKNLKKFALMFMLLPLALMAQPIVSKSRHMRIENAEVSVHYPGIQGAPIMRTYTITVVLKKEMKTLPDSIFVDGFAEKLILQAGPGNSNPIDLSAKKTISLWFKKGSRLTFTANVSINTAENAENNIAYSPKSALTGDGVCVVRFYTNKNGKKEPVYLQAKTLKKGTEVFAP